MCVGGGGGVNEYVCVCVCACVCMCVIVRTCCVCVCVAGLQFVHQYVTAAPICVLGLVILSSASVCELSV